MQVGGRTSAIIVVIVAVIVIVTVTVIIIPAITTMNMHEPHGVNVMVCARLLQTTGNRYTNLSTPETGLVKPATGLLYGRLPAVE